MAYITLEKSYIIHRFRFFTNISKKSLAFTKLTFFHKKVPPRLLWAGHHYPLHTTLNYFNATTTYLLSPQNTEGFVIDT